MIRKTLLTALVAVIAFATAGTALAQTISLSELVELFISLGIIAPEKVVPAREAVQNYPPNPAPVQPPFCYDFRTDLRAGDRGEALRTLQQILIREKLLSGDPSIGPFANSFDARVAAVVRAFQEKYRDEILRPYGLVQGTGYVGVTTRAVLNRLYGCGRIKMIQQTSSSEIVPSTLPPAVVGEEYRTDLSLEPPVIGTTMWNVSAGGVPPGLTLIVTPPPSPPYTNSAILAGTPTAEGAFSFTVRAQPTGVAALERIYTLLVREKGRQPRLTALTPMYGPAGTEVSVSGSSFSRLGNTVEFKRGGDSILLPNILSTDGMTLRFRVPRTLNVHCKPCAPGAICPLLACETTLVGPGKYKVRVLNEYGKSNPEKFEVTIDNVLTSPLTVLTPNGGEMWQIGSQKEIVWLMASTTDVDLKVSWTCSLDPEAECPEVDLADDVIAMGVPGDRAFKWKVGKLLSGESLSPGYYFVHACSNALCDKSDAPFTITSTTTTQPSITVLSPNGGETFTYGSSIPVRWMSANLPSGNIDIQLIKAGVVVDTYHDLSNNGTAQLPLSSSLFSGPDYFMRIKYPAGSAPIQYSDVSNEPFSIITSLPQTPPPSPNQTIPFDTDNSHNYSMNYDQLLYPSPERTPDLFVRGYARGIYAGALTPVQYIFGDGSSPPIPQTRVTSEMYSTYNDHCSSSAQLNEAYVSGSNKISAIGVSAPMGYVCMNGAFVPKANAMPSVVVLAPNGGETLRIDEPYAVRWSSTGLATSSAALRLLSATSSMERNIANGIPNSGMYVWTPATNTPAGTYRIRVLLGAYMDESNAPFTLVSNVPPPPGPNRPPVVDYFRVAPMGGTAPVSVGFTWLTSDPDRDPLVCAIDYGEGGGWSSVPCNGTVSHTYTIVGTYYATFRVSDGIVRTFARSPAITISPLAPQGYTSAQVAAHNRETDCWMIVSGKVYNVTSYIYPRDLHPGKADTIIPYCGRDGTQAYLTKDKGNPRPPEHSSAADQELARYYIGNLIGMQNRAPVVSVFNATPVTGPAPLVVRFTNSVSDPDGTALTCAIDYGEGGGFMNVPCSGSTSKTYIGAATYIAQFRVLDGLYRVSAMPIEIKVSSSASQTASILDVLTSLLEILNRVGIPLNI